MRIKVVIMLPDFSVGGAETMVAQIAKTIDTTLFDVTILVLRKKLNNFLEKSIEEKINIIYVNKGKGFRLSAFFKVRNILKKVKPDVLHTHLQCFLYSLLYIRFNKVYWLHTIHNIPEEESKGIRRKLLSKYSKKKKVNLVGISDTISNKITNLYKLDTCFTVYNPVDRNRFRFVNSKKRDNLIFLNVGRMTKQKNQFFLVKTFIEHLKDFPGDLLYIAGDGEYRELIENLIKDSSAENSIYLLGNVSNIELYMSKSDVFVLTSLFEGLPMTILEAMSCGLPIISSNVGGVCDIDKDNGILVDNPNSIHLFLESFRLIHSYALREKMSFLSNEYCDKYDLKSITKEYEKLYLNSKGVEEK